MSPALCRFSLSGYREGSPGDWLDSAAESEQKGSGTEGDPKGQRPGSRLYGQRQ